MRTLIKGAWVVGHENSSHRLHRDFQVAYENDRIVYVGPRFEGGVDHTIEAPDALVSPGFIDPHVHSGYRALHRLLTDVGRPDLYGQPYMEVSVPRLGSKIQGYPNYLSPEDAARDPTLELHAVFTVAELLRNGVTTFVELGSQTVVQDALWRQCERLGVRGYLGPGYDSGRWVGGKDGQLDYDPNYRAQTADCATCDFYKIRNGMKNWPNPNPGSANTESARVASFPLTVVPETVQTFIAYGHPAYSNTGLAILDDTLAPPTAGKARVRVFHGAYAASAASPSVTVASTIASEALAYATFSDAIEIDPGEGRTVLIDLQGDADPDLVAQFSAAADTSYDLYLVNVPPTSVPSGFLGFLHTPTSQVPVLVPFGPI